MYSIYIRFVFIAFVVMALSCKKQTVYNGWPVTLSVFNGLDNGVHAYGNYSGSKPASYRFSQILYNGGAFTTSFGEANVRARYFISPDTMEHDQPVFDQQLNVETGKYYSLYLLGGKPAADHLFFENHFAKYKNGDSITYMQMVNISAGQPVSVNIKGEPKGSLVSNLPYKGNTAFLALNANHNHSLYEFEFRDAATGDLLYTEKVQDIVPGPDIVNKFLYKNWTMVFMGKRNDIGINALKVRKTFYQIK